MSDLILYIKKEMEKQETNTTICCPLHIQDATNYFKISKLKLEKNVKNFYRLKDRHIERGETKG